MKTRLLHFLCAAALGLMITACGSDITENPSTQKASTQTAAVPAPASTAETQKAHDSFAKALRTGSNEQNPAALGAEGTQGSLAEALRTGSQSQTAAVAGPGSSRAVVPFSKLQIKKAEGENSYSVGELFEKKADLNGKDIILRGKAMKVSMNIMDKNWVHVQDGTGDPALNTYDLVVTTAAVPEKGAIIVVKGVLMADRDFGAGYRYSVIIEDAEITESGTD